ncbi:hypothetical protein [Pseudescherichia sp.]|uniref:hypothetical protein n=1 Tax=Pseudescherichia sp. TaxID=2055881 RepID=UPI00289F25C4|nr:hypothetical protein [Pseudescherichia sp.]
MKRLMLIAATATALTGCAEHARHYQCQSYADKANGASWGAAAAGTYIAQIQANIAERQYERCETAFDLVDAQKATTEVQSYDSSPVPSNVPSAPTRGDTRFNDLKGVQIAYTHNGLLMMGSEPYSFVKASPVKVLTEDDTDTSAKKGDSTHSEAYVNNSHTSGALIFSDSTQSRYWIGTFNILNGKPDKTTLNITEVKLGI